jgi:hypothetical protein
MSRIRAWRGIAAVVVSAIVAVGVAAPAGASEHILDPVATGAFCDGGPTSSPFTDLAADDPGRLQILCLAAPDLAIAQGQPDGTYRPRDTISRRQMALFLVRLIDRADQLQVRPVPVLAPYDGTNQFADVAGERPEVIAAVNRLAAASPPVVQGTSATTFSPGAEVTRRQMAAFVVRTVEHLAEDGLEDAGSAGFTDIAGESAEARRAIDLTASYGVFAGNPDGTFRPGETLTRRQMALVLTRTLQLLYEMWYVDSPFPGDYGTIAIEPLTGGAGVGTTRSLTATYTDASGAPVGGVELEVSVHRFLESTQDYALDGDWVIQERRTTNASGQITFSYTGPGEPSADELWVTRYAPSYGPRTPAEFSYFLWTVPAESGAYEVAAFDRDGDLLHAEAVPDGSGDDPTYLQRSFVLGQADVYLIGGATVSRADWLAALDDELDEWGAAFMGITYSTTGPSTFDLAG